MLYDNTSVQGSWLDISPGMEISRQEYGRIVNNVTMVFPHSGVVAAARDQANGILQPVGDETVSDTITLAIVLTQTTDM